jgi:hypothetical protein
VKIFDAESRNVRMHRLIVTLPAVAAVAPRHDDTAASDLTAKRTPTAPRRA